MEYEMAGSYNHAVDEEGRCLLTGLGRGFIKPYEETWPHEEAWHGDGELDWWFECESGHPLAVSAWIWKDFERKEC